MTPKPLLSFSFSSQLLQVSAGLRQQAAGLLTEIWTGSVWLGQTAAQAGRAVVDLLHAAIHEHPGFRHTAPIVECFQKTIKAAFTLEWMMYQEVGRGFR